MLARKGWGTAHPIQKAKPMPVHVRTCFSDAVLAELPHLRAYARLMTNDQRQADQGLEETLKRAMSILDRMPGRADLRIQLLTILRSVLIASERMRKDVMSPTAIYEKLNRRFGIINGNPEMPHSLASALVSLAYEDREAVALSAGMRLSPREAAKMCGCMVSVYNTRCRRGLTQLEELFPRECSEISAGKVTVSQVFSVTKPVGVGQEEVAQSFSGPTSPMADGISTS